MERKNAQRVATRRNNQIRKRLPLFADQLPVVTAEEVLEKHEQYQAAARQASAARQLTQIETRRTQMNQVRDQVSAAEFAAYQAAYAVCTWQHTFWSAVLGKLRRRADPLPDEAALVYAWLETWEGPPPTAAELHRSKGDGLDLVVIRHALWWLEERDYVTGGRLRLCTVAGNDSTPFWITAAL